jgi:hypothetical protein
MSDRRFCFVFFAKLMTIAGALAAVLLVASMCAAQPQNAISAASDPRLQNAYRFQQGGWTYVHLEGSPSDIGFQHG